VLSWNWLWYTSRVAFFATSHGKGPCAGVGGTVKRFAARASLQRPYSDQIMTPHQLFLFAKAVNLYYATTQELNRKQFCSAKDLKLLVLLQWTHKLHCIRPISAEFVVVKEFSRSQDARVERVLQSFTDKSIKLANIKGYITAKYDSNWWLGCVLQTFSETNEVEVNFLHPHGPARSFHFPPRNDILTISCLDVLTTDVHPTTSTGRTYTLSASEMITASTALAQQNK